MRTALALLLLSPLAAATDIVVSPGGSVQAAIDAAVDGDRVLVQAGTYHEAIHFGGKAIQVLGVAGPAATVLDASGLDASVVLFDDGEGPDSLLEGLTLRGGSGTVLDDWNNGVGGGVCAVDSSPTLRDCVIEGNTAASSGGGVFLLGDAGVATLLDGCILRDNQVTSTFQTAGGGGVQAFAAEVRLEDCLIAGNIVNGSGGGILFGGADGTLLRCTIADNFAASGAGGINAQLANGAELSIRDCDIRDNGGGEPGLAIVSSGGGMTVFSGSNPGTMVVTGTLIRGNYADSAPGIEFELSFGVTPAGTILTMDHCTFFGNFVVSPFLTGLGLHVDTDLEAGQDTGVDVRNCIFWGMGHDVWEAITPIPTPPFLHALPDVQFCNVENGYPGGGAGNFTADPQFAHASTGDFHLLPSSPCIGAGTPTPTGPPADFDGQAPVGAPDVGADEFALVLYTTGVAAEGETVHVKLVGPPGPAPTLCFVGAAPLDPPIVTAKGSFGVDPLFLFVLPGLPASGLIDVEAVVPPGVPAGVAAWLQAWTGGALTNVTALVFE